MLVRKIMTRKLITVRPDDTLRDVIQKLAVHDISSLPVVGKGRRLCGLVTEGDVIRAIDAYSPEIHYDTARSFSIVLAVLRRKPFQTIKSEILHSGGIPVKDFMNRKPRTIGPECSIYDAARALDRYRVKMLPVVDKGKKLLGVVARADIIRALAK
jgi:CBS domain-containing protein